MLQNSTRALNRKIMNEPYSTYVCYHKMHPVRATARRVLQPLVRTISLRAERPRLRNRIFLKYEYGLQPLAHYPGTKVGLKRVKISSLCADKCLKRPVALFANLEPNRWHDCMLMVRSFDPMPADRSSSVCCFVRRQPYQQSCAGLDV